MNTSFVNALMSGGILLGHAEGSIDDYLIARGDARGKDFHQVTLFHTGDYLHLFKDPEVVPGIASDQDKFALFPGDKGFKGRAKAWWLPVMISALTNIPGR